MVIELVVSAGTTNFLIIIAKTPFNRT